MKYTNEICPIIKKSALTATVFDFTVRAPLISGLAREGQFVTALCDGFTLRRPISICEIDRENETLRLVIESRGGGTNWLCSLPEGSSLDIIGPLGRGFEVKDTSLKAVFVGGGIGVPPLLQPAGMYGSNATAILGFRTASAKILCGDFERCGADVMLATDDGTEGHHGLVTDLLLSRLDAAPCDIIYACGPRPMLGAVAAIANERSITCKVSMEERMACGVGACLVCACETLAPNGNKRFAQVCKNGPVFSSKEVVW